MKQIKNIILILLLLGGLQTKAQLTPYYDPSTDLYGYKNSAGIRVVSPKYELAYSFDEGRAAVKVGGKYGYINQQGIEVIPAIYDQTWKFIGGYAAVKKDNRFGFIDPEGRVVVPLIYEEAYNHHGACCYKGMAHVRENGKWKIITLSK